MTAANDHDRIGIFRPGFGNGVLQTRYITIGNSPRHIVNSQNSAVFEGIFDIMRGKSAALPRHQCQFLDFTA